MDNLIDDLLLIIFEKLDLRTLLNLKLISKRWQRLIKLHYEDITNYQIQLLNKEGFSIELKFRNLGQIYFEVCFGAGKSFKKRNDINRFKELINDFNQRKYNILNYSYCYKWCSKIYSEGFMIYNNELTFRNDYRCCFCVKIQRNQLIILKLLTEVYKIALIEPETDHINNS